MLGLRIDSAKDEHRTSLVSQEPEFLSIVNFTVDNLFEVDYVTESHAIGRSWFQYSLGQSAHILVPPREWDQSKCWYSKLMPICGQMALAKHTCGEIHNVVCRR
jgi:hypothetical protein